MLPGISGHLERLSESRFISVHLSSSQGISGRASQGISSAPAASPAWLPRGAVGPAGWHCGRPRPRAVRAMTNVPTLANASPQSIACIAAIASIVRFLDFGYTLGIGRYRTMRVCRPWLVRRLAHTHTRLARGTIGRREVWCLWWCFGWSSPCTSLLQRKSFSHGGEVF